MGDKFLESANVRFKSWFNTISIIFLQVLLLAAREKYSK